MFEFNTIIISLGLVFATVSLISGFQAVKKDKSIFMLLKMHRLNGYLTFLLYIVVAALLLRESNGVRLWSIAGWLLGLMVIAGKILAVRNARTYKYGSRIGIILFVTWLFIIITHIQ